MDVIEVTSEEIERVRKQFNVDENVARQNVKQLKKWITEQKNLPTIDDENFLERCLLRNKFRLEQTKKKIHGYFTVRSAHIHMFDDFKSIIPSQERTTTLPLPKLTPDLERVIVWKLKNSTPSDYDLTSIVKYNLLLFEILIRNDYAVGDRFIADFTGHSFTSLMRNNPFLISKFISLYQGAYSGRLLGCDFINAPGIINFLLTILKKTLPTKMYDRIRIHRDLESFQKAIPKEYLPKDYGGELDSVENLIKKWDKVFEHHQKIFEENLKRISKEKPQSSEPEVVNSNFEDLNLD